MDDISGDFLRKWREKYRWPFCLSRIASEEKILCLENLVINNVLKSGSWSVKDVLLEIVNWKTGGAQVPRFCANNDETVFKAVTKVKQILRENPNDVSQCIDIFSHPHLSGVAIPVASAFLRFLDPIEHKYGIIDKNVANFLNIKGITDFHFDERGYLIFSPENVNEYQKYHNWLQQKAEEFDKSGSTYRDIYGIERKFSATDIDMALFTFSFLNKRNLKGLSQKQTERRPEQVSEWLKQYEEDVSMAFEDYLERMDEHFKYREEEYMYPLFECPYCGKRFATEEELQEHELKHN